MSTFRKLTAAGAVLGLTLAFAIAAAPAHAALTATFTKAGEWGSGYEGKYTITNATTASVTWRVEFDLPAGATISSSWDATVTVTGTHVVATGTWNATLAPSGTASFGWIGAPAAGAPTNCTINGGACNGTATPPPPPPPNDSAAPTTPGNLTSPGKTSNTVNLSWGASTDSGGSGLAGYNVYRNSSGPANPVAQTTGTATSFTDTARQPNTTYTYVVRARDGAGNLSTASNQISVTTNQGPTTPPPGTMKKVGYYTQWSVYASGRNFQLQDVDQLAQAGKLTHIHYAFANINEQGRCFEANQAGVGDAWADYQARLSGEMSIDGVADTFNQPLAGNFNQIKKLKAKHPHLKVLMSLGGWTWSKYFSNAALPQNRAAFVASCIDLFIKGNLPQMGGEPQGGPGSAFGIFDGFDLDWEWPGSEGNVGNVIRAEDKANFTALLQEFRNQLNAYGATVGRQYLLAAFLPADPAKITAGFQPQIFNHLDYATVQGYDFYGAWEPQTNHQSQLRSPTANPAPRKFSIEIAIDSWLALQAPLNKLVLGLPAFGRGWTGVPNVNQGVYQNGTAAPGRFEAGIDDYKLVKTKPGSVFRDTSAGAVWKFDGTTYWAYDDSQLVQEKANWVKSRGLGGLMLWALDGDDGTLVNAMHVGLQ